MSVPTRLTGLSPEAAPNPSLAVSADLGSSGAGRLLSAWLAELDPAALRRYLGPAVLAELHELERETDPQFLSQAWFNFAYRQQQAGRLELAALSFHALADSGLNDAGRAQRQLEAMQGRGGTGRRWEFLLGQFAEQAADPAMLGGMMLASTVFQGVRFAGLSRLLANPEATWLTRGAGARWAAASLGFAAEVPTFLLSSKGIHQALGHAEDWSAPALSREGLGLGVNLLFLKGFAALGRSGIEAFHGAAPGTSASLRIMSTWLPQASSLAGIYLGHRAESWLGLRPRLDDATTLTDSLCMLLQFHVGGQLSSALLGPNFAQGTQALEIYSRTMGPGPRGQGDGIPTGELVFGGRPALAAAGRAPSSLEPGFLPPLNWHSVPVDPLRMNSLGEGESSNYQFLERKLRAQWLESLEPGPEAGPELRDRFPRKVEELSENYLRTPGIDLQRYYGLLRESRLQDIHHDDGRVTTRLEQLSVAAKYFRHVMEMNTFRRAVGSLYDHLMQEAFERALAEGTVDDFDALIRVAGVHRRIEAVEGFLRDRSWHTRYALQENSAPPPPPPTLFERLRTRLRLPIPRIEAPTPVWIARLKSLPLSPAAKATVEKYLYSFDTTEAAAPFRAEAHNYILWKPSKGAERREGFTVSVAMDGLQTYLKTWRNHPRHLKVLEDAIARVITSPAPLLHLDRIFKLLATRDLPHKIAEVASREEFNWGQLEGILELSSDEPGWASSTAKLNGTIYTGYIYDAILAEKFCRFYQGAGVYLHQVEMQIRLGRFHYRAKELLEDKVSEGLQEWMSERNRLTGSPPSRAEALEKRATLERSVNYDKQDIMYMLQLNPTFVAKQAIDAIENKEVELQLLSKDAMRDLWRSLPHDEKEKDPPSALYVPADKSPTKKPLIVVTKLDANLTRDQKIVQAITLAALVVHEFEHYLHRNESSNVMISEMRAWLEEYYFLMHHGQNSLWYEMQETTPYGFGVFLRNLVDKDYLEGPRDVPLRLKR